MDDLGRAAGAGGPTGAGTLGDGAHDGADGPDDGPAPGAALRGRVRQGVPDADDDAPRDGRDDDAADRRERPAPGAEEPRLEDHRGPDPRDRPDARLAQGLV